MSLVTALVIAAVIASIVLLLDSKARLFPAIALVASGIEALFAFKVLTVRVKGVNLWLILAIALVVAGVVVWVRNSNKNAVTAATVVALVGAIQVFSALR